IKNLIFFLLNFSVISLFAQQGKQNTSIDQKVKALLSQMTLEEKAGQMTQISVEFLLKNNNGNPVQPHEIDPHKLAECIHKYKIGSILNVGGNAQTVENWQKNIQAIQSAALKERLKIPVLYGIDAIHGNNYTLNSVLFPQQIAQAASFNRDIIEKA